MAALGGEIAPHFIVVRMKLKPIVTVPQVPATQYKCLEIELKLSFDYLFLHKIQLASIWWQSVAIVAIVARGG